MSTNLVKPIVGILTSRPDSLPRVLDELRPNFGNADIIGQFRPFDHTSYYENEMGGGLLRTFVSFAELKFAENAKDFKTWTKEIEEIFSQDQKRTVNLDPGFVDANKVVLITGKHGGHKIKLSKDVWADFLLWYNKGWVALPWAFPDFRDGGLFPLFTKMRTCFKRQYKTADSTVPR